MSSTYFNRELSWLTFNRRVLDLAKDPSIPLLERVKFLAIVSSNLDEFFEIRVAGLIQQAETHTIDPELYGSTPAELLPEILALSQSLVRDQYTCWHNQLVPALAQNNIHMKTAAELSPAEIRWLNNYFNQQVLPVLTPLAIDPSHPFPFLQHKSLNIAVSLNNPDQSEPQNLAIIPVPRILPRIIQVPSLATKPRNGSSTTPAPITLLFLSEVIKHNANKLFPGCTIYNSAAFRVTRNNDLYIDEEEADNLLQAIEQGLRDLRRGDPVRLEIEENAPSEIFTTLCRHLNLPQEYIFKTRRPLNLSRLMALSDLPRPDLKYPPFTPANTTPLANSSNIFATLRRQDIHLHHPYDSFQPVIDFIQTAATDPQVLAIKQTLYRTSGDSPFIPALIQASRNGKQVTALVELKARGDEANNIQWARQLEEAGVHVVYGLLGHKIHGKCALVIRREGQTLRRYAHFGTGNYNPSTARQYTDIGYFTTRPDFTNDAAKLFNTLTGLSRPPKFQSLLIAPYNLFKTTLKLIRRETANAKAGKPARIIAKMNALVEKDIIDALYTASQAGVKIDLIIRGTCCLIPGVKNFSENIRVRSILGRFLEHARAYYFHNHGKTPVIYAGSADWMPRNLHRRVEILYPITSPKFRHWILHHLFATELADTRSARELRPDGTYSPIKNQTKLPPISAQSHFLSVAKLHHISLPKKPLVSKPPKPKRKLPQLPKPAK